MLQRATATYAVCIPMVSADHRAVPRALADAWYYAEPHVMLLAVEAPVPPPALEPFATPAATCTASSGFDLAILTAAALAWEASCGLDLMYDNISASPPAARDAEEEEV